jgi:hypothetical protein
MNWKMNSILNYSIVQTGSTWSPITYIKEIEHYLNRKLELILTVSTEDAILVSKEKASEFLSWMDNR